MTTTEFVTYAHNAGVILGRASRLGVPVYSRGQDIPQGGVALMYFIDQVGMHCILESDEPEFYRKAIFNGMPKADASKFPALRSEGSPEML